MTSPHSLPAPFNFGLFSASAAPKRRALFLDYDGTLAAFHVDRWKAVPSAEMLSLLIQLSSIKNSRVALVSGRTVQDLRALLGDAVRIEMWGDYGWERWRPDGSTTIWNAPKQDAVIFMEAAAMAAPYVDRQHLEFKTASVAIHTRALPDTARNEVSAVITRLWSQLATQNGLELLPFNGGFELRDILRTKGTAVHELCDELDPNTHVSYIGDDIADEDAFVSITESGWSILVADARRLSHAQYCMRPGRDVMRFLKSWIQWDGGSHATDLFSQQRTSRLA